MHLMRAYAACSGGIAPVRGQDLQERWQVSLTGGNKDSSMGHSNGAGQGHGSGQVGSIG